MHRALNSAHRLLARSAVTTHAAVLLRNQCGQVIRYRLGESDDSMRNGEALFLRAAAPHFATAIDVGANVGGWTTQFLNARGSSPTTILLVEPQPRIARALRDTVGHLAGVEVIEAAAGDAPGSLVLHESTDSELSSFVRADDVPYAGTREVQVTTIDQEVAARRWDGVDLLKIDAEGYDLHVARGASGLLAQGRIKAVQFEYNRSWAAAGSTLAAAYEFFRKHDYQVFLLRGDGLYELRYEIYGEYFAYSNFVAVKQGAVRWLNDLLRGPI